MYVVAFDRDHTVDVNPPANREAVPLEWVRHLARETDQQVWATGNQRLTDEAGIPGVRTAIRRLADEGALPEPVERDLPERWNEEPSVTRFVDRSTRVRLLERVHPDATGYLVVDDVNLSHLDGWRHYYPWDFVEAVRSDELEFDLGLPPR